MTIRSGLTGPGGGNIPDGSVTESKIVAGAVVSDHINSGLVLTDANLGAATEHTLKFVYDGAVLGYTQGVYTLTADGGGVQQIPAYSTITRSAVRVVTGVLSAGSATVSAGYTGAAAGLLAATGKASLAAGVGISTLPTIAAPIVIGSSAVNCTATVGTADLTAGKLVVWVTYLPGTATS